MAKKTLGIALLLVCFLPACNKNNSSETANTASKPLSTPGTEPSASSFNSGQAANNLSLQVYKSPTCGCCGQWVEHMRKAGFTAQVHDEENLEAIKQNHGLPWNAHSCHTAVSAEGYVFEGHVPAGIVKRFLAEHPTDARGLVVPEMPMGSPGMEMGDKFTPYEV
ncbi:MAG TPA: DUF411 domain-containing protein, partial [Pseudomonadales bacterium]|nr:DUF411 domain-containing protein [Pseudomonadales bacterium]